MRLYFVRHGESEANTRHVISNRESPFRLTPRGKQQAEALAKNLEDVQVTAIYSSPVRRARQTAEILAASFDQTVQVTEALREYDCGILEERSDDESWRLHREIAEDWTRNHNHLRKPEGGESFLDIQNRFLPFIERLTDQGLNKDDQIVLVGHGGLFHMMLPLILTNIDRSFVRAHGMGHTEYVLAEDRPTGLACLQWGSVRFDSRESPQMS